MADFPAAAYEIVTLQGALLIRKTVRFVNLGEQGIFQLVQTVGVSKYVQTRSLLLCDQGITEDVGMCLLFN